MTLADAFTLNATLLLLLVLSCIASALALVISLKGRK